MWSVNGYGLLPDRCEDSENSKAFVVASLEGSTVRGPDKIGASRDVTFNDSDFPKRSGSSHTTPSDISYEKPTEERKSAANQDRMQRSTK